MFLPALCDSTNLTVVFAVSIHFARWSDPFVVDRRLVSFGERNRHQNDPQRQRPLQQHAKRGRVTTASALDLIQQLDSSLADANQEIIESSRQAETTAHNNARLAAEIQRRFVVAKAKWKRCKSRTTGSWRTNKKNYWRTNWRTK